MSIARCMRHPMNGTAIPKLLLRPPEAAQSLGISTRALWSLTSPRGPIPAVYLGRSVRYDPDALRQWIAETQAAGCQGDEGKPG
jgi:predicted DNA-binding transcriptional regulator AlpA